MTADVYVAVTREGFVANAFQSVREFKAKWAEAPRDELDLLIYRLTGIVLITGTQQEAEVTAGYIIQESILMHDRGEPTTAEHVMAWVKKKVAKFFRNSLMYLDVVETTTGADGVLSETITSAPIKPIKQNRRQLCQDKYAKDGKSMTPKEFRDWLMSELGMTKGGATTYEFNCRNDKW